MAIRPPARRVSCRGPDEEKTAFASMFSSRAQLPRSRDCWRSGSQVGTARSWKTANAARWK